jgi:hypothetical protein
MKLVSVRIHHHHAAQTREALVWWLLHSNIFAPELLEPAVDVRHVQMNETADRAIALVLGEEERKAVTGHLCENRKARVEPVFPIDLKTETLNVEPLAPC